jgi:hypothetical protein
VKRIQVMAGAAKLAQWRSDGEDWRQIKAARKAARIEAAWPIIRRYVTEAEMQAIRKRGCLHVADFPEKSDPKFRVRGRRDGGRT